MNSRPIDNYADILQARNESDLEKRIISYFKAANAYQKSDPRMYDAIIANLTTELQQEFPMDTNQIAGLYDTVLRKHTGGKFGFTQQNTNAGRFADNLGFSRNPNAGRFADNLSPTQIARRLSPMGVFDPTASGPVLQPYESKRGIIDNLTEHLSSGFNEMGSGIKDAYRRGSEAVENTIGAISDSLPTEKDLYGYAESAYNSPYGRPFFNAITHTKDFLDNVVPYTRQYPKL